MVKQRVGVPHLDDKALNVFTDGSSFSGPRRGGIGIHYVWADDAGNEVAYDLSPAGYSGATNQEMELKACIEGLAFLTKRHCPVRVGDFSKVVIITDSMYVKDGYAQARGTWRRNGWRTREGNPVRHAVMWKELCRAADRLPVRVEVRWHKGHSSQNPNNREADRLARSSASGSLKAPLAPKNVRRKKSTHVEVRGCVPLLGQRLRIRIVSADYLKTHRMHTYKYEVVSRGPLHDLVDRTYSDKLMKAGHVYDVRMNDDAAAPRVLKVFREIP